MEKKKRIVTRIGNVFCIEIDNTFKRYFQYISNDMTQLNSSVIRVFKTDYALSCHPSVDQIIEDEVDFYMLVMLRPGIADGIWYKVGTSNKVGDTEQVMFRMFGDLDVSQIAKSHNWYVWKINQPHIYIGELTENYRHLELGFVVPYSDVIARIKTGKINFKQID